MSVGSCIGVSTAGRSCQERRSRLVASAAMAWRVSCVAEPMCGSGVTPGGCAGRRQRQRLVANTLQARCGPWSSGAAGIRPTHGGPSRQIDEMAPGFMAANSSALTIAPRAVGQTQHLPPQSPIAPATRAAGCGRFRPNSGLELPGPPGGGRGTSPACQTQCCGGALRPGQCGQIQADPASSAYIAPKTVNVLVHRPRTSLTTPQPAAIWPGGQTPSLPPPGVWRSMTPRAGTSARSCPRPPKCWTPPAKGTGQHGGIDGKSWSR